MTILLLFASALFFQVTGGPGSSIERSHYSTCPVVTLDEAVRQNVAYAQVETQELVKYATLKVQPRVPPSCKCSGQVRVEVKVESGKVRCATALSGHPALQRAAVEAAMQWRFRVNPKSGSDVTGELVFDLKR